MKSDLSKKVEDNAPINDFNGHYQFLNNDYPSWVCLDSILYPSASIAYQSARTDDISIRKSLNEVQTYEKFKQISLSIVNPPDWTHRKYSVMERLLRDKFKRNKQIGSKLAATSPRTLINSFKSGGQNQEYWGVVSGKGYNAIGKILMSIRQEMLNGSDWDKWVSDQDIEQDEKMRPAATLIVTREDKPIDKLFLEHKSKFFFGNQQTNDFKLDHPSISKIHACIYYGPELNLMLVDLGSSNGTSITRDKTFFKLQPLKPIALQSNDLIGFGLSSRKYRLDVDSSKVKEYLTERQKKVEDEIKQMHDGRRPRSSSPKGKRKGGN